MSDVVSKVLYMHEEDYEAIQNFSAKFGVKVDDLLVECFRSKLESFGPAKNSFNLDFLEKGGPAMGLIESKLEPSGSFVSLPIQISKDDDTNIRCASAFFGECYDFILLMSFLDKLQQEDTEAYAQREAKAQARNAQSEQ